MRIPHEYLYVSNYIKKYTANSLVSDAWQFYLPTAYFTKFLAKIYFFTANMILKIMFWQKILWNRQCALIFLLYFQLQSFCLKFPICILVINCLSFNRKLKQKLVWNFRIFLERTFSYRMSSFYFKVDFFLSILWFELCLLLDN